MKREKAQELIQHMNRLANNVGATEAEREAALSKMSQLMQKYDVELIEDEDETAFDAEERKFRFYQKDSYRRQRVRLLHAVLSYFDCMSLESVQKTWATVYAFGTARDMEASNLLFDGLWEQMLRDKEDAMLVGRGENYSFVVGWVNGLRSQVNQLVRRRKREANKAKRQLQLSGSTEPTKGMELTQTTGAIVLHKQKTAKELMNTTYPNTGTNSYQASVSDDYAYNAGFEDGRNANVGNRLDG